MDLNLPQRLYLLGYDVDRGRPDPVGNAQRGRLLCAAAVVDLIGRGLLRERDGRVERTLSSRTPDDRLLSLVLSGVPSHRPRHWVDLVHRRMVESEEHVRDGLAARGVITVGGRRILGLFPSRTITLTDADRVRGLHARTRAAVVEEHDVAAVDGEDLALAVIASEGEIQTAFTARERWDHRRTLAAFHGRFDAAFPGLRTAIGTAVRASKGPTG
ncbi:GPP34 family phosphoprotein [Nocardiopsis sp. MG754419]|uniref:GOLPH3/VPS74 family protein n=1 Tax=Nocardiopsis sp. MG754419 TaxID=2259865 RepID=UPI001BA53FD4|nr:GPP34 family phosphoprotein [Nocardiopsis sp. MG754419]MBR8741063.1 GPP34 family phosphoprotein [Nocardiopsis sp. MG754419]